MSETDSAPSRVSAANDPSSGVFIVDHTSLSMFKECPQKYKLAIVDGYRLNTTAAPLVFGSAIHEGLEQFERALARGQDRTAALVHAIRAALVYKLPEGDTGRTRETLIRSLVWYEAHYRNDFAVTHILPSGKPAVELSFRVELPFTFAHSDAPVLYCGHIDKIVNYQDRLFAMEHKTTKSALSDHYWLRYTFSSQISGYNLACELSFNTEIGGAIIDSLQVGVNFTRFGRRIAARTKVHQQEWLLDTHYWLEQLNSSFTTDRWPHNHESCSKFGGCQFRDVCFASPLVRESVLRTHYRVERWDPLKPRGEEE